MTEKAKALTGRCLCGGVQYRVTGEVDDAVACHCLQCQRQSGGIWMSFFAPREQVEITGSSLHWVSISPEAWRGFCRDCGGYLFWQPVTDEMMMISFGSLDDTGDMRLRAHHFVNEVRLHLPEDGLPRFPADESDNPGGGE